MAVGVNGVVVGSVPDTVRVAVRVPVAVVVTLGFDVKVLVAEAFGSGVKVSVAVAVSATVGGSVKMAVNAGVSVAGSRVGVGSALSVSTASVKARAASVACTSTTGAPSGCCKNGSAVQALKKSAITNG